MKAARNGRDDIARDLLEAGAAVNLRDHNGNTALHHAALGGATDAVSVLLEFGADPEARNGEGKRPADLEPEAAHIMLR
jgi:ankyrin repeat protein